MTGHAHEADRELRQVDDAIEVVQLLDLVEIITYEIGGRRKDAAIGDGHDEAPTEGGVVDDEREEGTEQGVMSPLQILTRSTPDELAIRVSATGESREVDVRVDFAVIYTKAEHFEPTARALQEFITRAAIGTAFPYIREAFSATATRLGATFVLGMWRPGAYQPHANTLE